MAHDPSGPGLTRLGRHALRSALLGGAIGLVGTLLVWLIALGAWPGPAGLDALIALHTDQPAMLLVTLAPLAWAAFGGWLGRAGDIAIAAQRELDRAEGHAGALAHYEQALMGLDDGILVEQDGRIVVANQAAGRILGADPGALAGQPVDRFLTLVHPIQGARDATGRPLNAEVSSTQLDDGPVVHHLREVTEAHQAVARQRRVNHILVDERDRAEARDLAKQRFLAGLAHELRTPLASIRGYLEIIEEEAQEQGAPVAMRDLARVRMATDQVLGVVKKVHEQAMPVSGKLALYVVPFDVGEVLDEVVEAVGPLVPEGVELHARVEPLVGPIRGDRQRFAQILLTLVIRAATHTSSGSIRLTADLAQDPSEAQPEPSPVRTTVADTGAGIPRAELKALFSPFAADGATIGLPICHELARLMHGDLTVESVEGRGTTFTLILPAATDGSRGELLVRPRTPVGHGRMLILADAPGVRGQLEAGLGARGVQVIVAASAQAARESALALTPAVVVVDLGLRRRDPWTELERLTSVPELAHVPVLGLTVDGPNAVLLPLSGVLSMPPDPARLQERVHGVGHPSRPILVVGGGPGTARPLRELGHQVVHTSDRSEAVAALDDAGVVFVDLLSNSAAGLAFALDHADAVPTVGLLNPSPTEPDRAAARRVLHHQVRTQGSTIDEVLDDLIRRLGPTSPIGMAGPAAGGGDPDVPGPVNAPGD